jgi:antitoxin MazE
MLVSVVAIGNSKGVRIPKSVLDQLDISDKVDMEIDNQQIILKPIKKKPRAGWDNAFKEMHREKNDTLLFSEITEQDDFQWEW